VRGQRQCGYLKRGIQMVGPIGIKYQVATPSASAQAAERRLKRQSLFYGSARRRIDCKYMRIRKIQIKDAPMLSVPYRTFEQ